MSGLKNISVIGAGLMGHGIAVAFARAGHKVRVYDAFADSLKALPARAAASLEQLGHTAPERDAALGLIEAQGDLAECVAGADIVIEAAPEDLELKRQIFTDIEAAAQRDCILASNTSVIPITSIVSGLKHRERALGTHWWNPPHLIPLVEVIRTEWSSEDAMGGVMDLLTSIGKTPVRVEKDVPGFIGNRLQHALWREAISLVENGICDASAVDTVINSSFGRRLSVLGPLANADLVGTDLTLAIHQNVLSDLEASGRPSPYLEKLVAGGRLGMKSGEGFYEWTPEDADALRQRVSDHLRKLETILG
ncbi:3-hydroxyacyl-CoA dehydrogenase family protein [Hoeflea poritis]|uniref:3-hydroxyacyl-CoA dehydrogenase family protein n=1 Tax=Hoeflea poritis TaxID=2993659 RepID=A0ABT4VHC6_9HYPH|nr:3-hydroxyacyl-CoA dehydrogenase family protein [Hoeflea poritis]MDA4844086.1 3-hydroxyacyl-CoA dehydrogenase family protein [Hoeflea poritis]